MSKNNTPKLRFPEFSGEWEEKTIKSISSFIKDGTHGTHKNVTKGVFLLSAKDIKNGKVKIPEDSRIISQNDFNKIHKNYTLRDNDLLITIVGSIGEVAIIKNYDYSYTFQRSVAIVRTSENPKFISQIFHTDLFSKQMKKRINFSAQGGIYLGELSKIKINIPSIKEQEKIANFLTQVDEKINLLKERLDYFNDFKKFCMEQLFAQKLRFKSANGEDYPDWEEKNFEEIFKSISSKNFQIKKTDVQEKGNYPVIDQGKTEILGYSNEETKIFNNIPVILYGDHTTIIKYSEEKFIVGADGVKLLKSKTNEDLKYLFYGLKYFNIKSEGYKRHYSILKKINMPIPTLEEQRKVANFLTSIDNKTEKIEFELRKMKEFKKGLLQQMFV
jgi:type I restriction enzyme S subunit